MWGKAGIPFSQEVNLARLVIVIATIHGYPAMTWFSGGMNIESQICRKGKFK
jgi:hypothetical protein